MILSNKHLLTTFSCIQYLAGCKKKFGLFLVFKRKNQIEMLLSSFVGEHQQTKYSLPVTRGSTQNTEEQGGYRYPSQKLKNINTSGDTVPLNKQKICFQVERPPVAWTIKPKSDQVKINQIQLIQIGLESSDIAKSGRKVKNTPDCKQLIGRSKMS